MLRSPAHAFIHLLILHSFTSSDPGIHISLTHSFLISTIISQPSKEAHSARNGCVSCGPPGSRAGLEDGEKGAERPVSEAG